MLKTIRIQFALPIVLATTLIITLLGNLSTSAHAMGQTISTGGNPIKLEASRVENQNAETEDQKISTWQNLQVQIPFLYASILTNGTQGLGLLTNPSNLLASSLGEQPTAPTAQQCFYQAGIYGNLIVTTSGSGCGNFINYGGITGLWLDSIESCTFDFSYPIDRSTASVAFTAAGENDIVRFQINGADYPVIAEEIDDSNPIGGDDPIVLRSDGTIGGPLGGDATDGRATVNFNPGEPVTSVGIFQLNATSAGTVYLICVDDIPVDTTVSITTVNPIPNGHNAALTENVSFTANAALNPASVTPLTFVVHGGGHGWMNGTITASNGDTTFTYDPTQDFFPGELVQVSASRQILDSGGTSITPYVWQFRTAVSGGSGDFGLTAHDNFGAGDSFAVALGDVDGDGDPDAVIANYANQPQEVWLNDGAGDFGIAAYDSFGAGDSRSVALGDVDGDGDLDAVIANTNGQAQEVWLNDGVGDFGAAAYASFGAGDSQAVTLGDVDGDGNLDAVIANTNGQAQEVWLNDGAGGFGVAAYDSFGAGDSYWTALGDLDGDGDLDAVIANTNGQAQEVWLNNGSGGFGAAAHDSFGAGDSYSVALGDVDGDGDLDAVIANYSGQAQEVWLNDGGGGFGVAAYDSFGAGDSYSVALGDLDGDSDLDAVIANSGGTQPQEVWLNDGQGGFDAATPAGFGTGYGVSVALGDLDGDGDLDAVIANIGGQAQESWLNQNQVDLSIQTTAEPYIAAPGNPLTFTLDYKNNGPNLATQVVITDAIPANVIDTTVSSSGAAITQIGTAPNYAWSVADLSPGQGGTIIIQGFIASPQAAGTFLNIASIATVVSDTNIANNTSSATVVVPNVPPQVTAEFYAAQQNTTLDVAAPGVLNNDSDPNGDPVFAGLLNTPSVGTLNLNANGAFTYNPATDQVGTVTFDYVAYDGPLAEQNLLGLWKFDEGSGTNAADASGNGNAGTLLNGPTWLTATPAVQFADPYAISFDGIDDYLQLPPNFPNTDDFSFAAWIYWRGGGAWQRIFDFGPDTQYNMFLTPRSDAGTLRFAITTNFKGGEQLLNAPSALPENQWVHVALTLEGDTGKLWIDGVMQDTQTITLNPSDIVSRPNSNTWLGKSNYSDPYLNGSLDEVRIYGRALSEIEIATLASGQPSTAGLSDTATASIVVQPAVPQADLYLKSLRLVPDQVCRGQQFAVIFEHSNLGNLAVGAHTVTFFNESSPNSFINPIGSAPIPSAAPWQDQHFGFNTNSYLTGTRYLTLYADFDNLISEFDEANNFKTIPITVTLDPAPTGMLLINGGADLTNDPTLTLSLQAVDSGACATSVAAMRFAYGGNLTPWEPYTTTKTLTLSADGPNLRVEVQFRDQHGNASPFIGAQITLDSIPPATSVNAPGGNTSAAQFAVEWQGQDQLSGLDYFDVQVKMDEDTWLDWITSTQAISATFTDAQPSHRYCFRSRGVDAAQNVEPYPEGLGDTCLWVTEPASGVDLHVENIEFTQAIQTPANSVPLVTGKPLLVRATLGSSPDSPALGGVSGLLHVSRNGQALPGSPLSPPNEITIYPNPVPDLGENLLEFLLPSAWLTGTLEVYLEIDPGEVISETDENNNRFPATGTAALTFNPRADLELTLIPVIWERSGETLVLSSPEALAYADWVQRLFPVANVQVRLHTAYRYQGDTLDWPRLLAEIDALRAAELPNPAAYQKYLGLVPYPSDYAAAEMGLAQQPGVSAALLAAPGNEWLAARYLAYTFGRQDVASSCNTPPNPDPAYPYPDGGIQYPGWNYGDGFVPGATPELLAGCNAGWISDYTYRALYEQLVPVNPVVALGQSGAALPAFTPQLPDFVQPLSVNSASVDSGSLLVTGRVALDGSTGRFLAAFELPENRGTSFIQQGDFRVVLIDKNGHEAALRTWNPDTTNLGPNSPQPFAFTFNNPPDLSAVRLYYQDTLLDELTPGTPPTVTITSPAPPLTSTNTYTLTWGPTPSESTFLVRYSRDHGATWQTLSAPIIGNAYPVDLSTLPGTDHGIFEVIASTGLESAAAQLSGFALENKAPVVRIFTPKADAPFGGSLTFSGSAFDLEDGWLAPGQLSWLGDQDGVLGTGYTLNALLTPGLQRITLQVLDSSAQVGQDERANFTQIFLPLVKR